MRRVPRGAGRGDGDGRGRYVQRVADEARNSFVAQATHELRTPLTNIGLYTDAMIEDSDNPEIRTSA